MSAKARARSKQSLAWASAMTREQREAFIQQARPLMSNLQGEMARCARRGQSDFSHADAETLRDTQSRLAACRRLNRKESDVPT